MPTKPSNVPESKEFVAQALTMFVQESPTKANIEKVLSKLPTEEIFAEHPEELYELFLVVESLADVREEFQSDDLLEVSNLRYDDDGYEQSSAHLNAARIFLLGKHGVKIDIKRGLEQVQFMKAAFDHLLDDYLKEDLEELMTELDSATCQQIERILA